MLIDGKIINIVSSHPKLVTFVIGAAIGMVNIPQVNAIVWIG